MDANVAKSDRALCPRCGAPVTRHSLKGLCRRCIARVTLPQSEKPSPADSGLRVRCPQCGRPIELAEGSGLSDIRCDSCGTHFNIVDDQAATQTVVGLAKVGQFEVLEQVGTGAFGTVWKARDTRLDRLVAIKIPRQRHLEPAEAEKFLREARAAAQLRHPNIVSVFEVGSGGRPDLHRLRLCRRRVAGRVAGGQAGQPARGGTALPEDRRRPRTCP